jgi:hypothetical protein
MNSPGLQQRTRCSRPQGNGSLLLVHPLSSDETKVSTSQKGDNVPKILLLTKYPYGLSSFLWPYQDVHTFPMRYVTELACEHSCPLNSDLNSVHQATGHSGYPHKFSRATGQSLSAQEFTSTWTFQLSAQGYPTSHPRTESHPRSTNRPQEAGRPGPSPMEPISSGLLLKTLRHLQASIPYDTKGLNSI